MAEDRKGGCPTWREGPLLPPGMFWVYLLAPVGSGLLMSKDVVTASPPELLHTIGCEYVPFLAYGGAFHVVYRYAMPSLLAAMPGRFARMGAHALAILLVPAAVAFLLHPPFELVVGRPLPFVGFAVNSIVISAFCVVPALLVQHLRVRALTAERAVMAERQAALRAQLQALQARTDPHFLFNSLNTVAALIPEDPPKAERTLEQLADLFRYALQSSRARVVSLQREVDMISNYLALQTARFGERLRTHLEMDDRLADVHVPPLLLQPLVENAILHGAARHKGGEVRISVRRDGERLVIEVADDGPGPGASSYAGAGSAVSGIAERIRLHYSDRAEFALQPRPEGGCLARLVLPLVEAG